MPAPRRSVHVAKTGGTPLALETHVENAESDDFMQKPRLPRYENTFIMDPSTNIKAKVKPIRDIMEKALARACTREYTAPAAKTMAINATQTIHREIKGLGLDRYKTIVHVFVGELGQHDLKHASKSLWDSKVDTVIDCKLIKQQKNLMAFACVFCIYYE